MNIGQYFEELRVFAEKGKCAIAEYWCYGLMIACVLIVIRIARKCLRNMRTSIRIKKSGELRDWGLPFWSYEEFMQGYHDYLETRAGRDRDEKHKSKNSK